LHALIPCDLLGIALARFPEKPRLSRLSRTALYASTSYPLQRVAFPFISLRASDTASFDCNSSKRTAASKSQSFRERQSLHVTWIFRRECLAERISRWRIRKTNAIMRMLRKLCEKRARKFVYETCTNFPHSFDLRFFALF